MMTNSTPVTVEQSESRFSKALQNQVAIANNNSVAQVSWSSSSDSSDIEDDEKQVDQIRPQAFTDNAVNVVNTFTGNTGVNSTVNNTNIYKDGVTVNNNIYCCPTTSDFVGKWCWRRRRRIIIFLVTVLGISIIIFLGVWLSNIVKVSELPDDAETETIPSTTNVPPPSTDSTTMITSTTVLSTSTDASTSSTSEIPNDEWRIIGRNEWKAEPPSSPPEAMSCKPPMYVVFSETQTETCTTTTKCMDIIRQIQATQMNDYHIDIGYNFLIGGDGMVYEGRGWDHQADESYIGSHQYRDKAISVSFIGRFGLKAPTEIILQAAHKYLEYGKNKGELSKNQTLKCLRDMRFSSNPGFELYVIIKSWEGWEP